MISNTISHAQSSVRHAFGLAHFWGLFLVLVLLAPTASYAQTAGDTTARRLLQEGKASEALSVIERELKQRPRDGQLLLLKGAALTSSDKKNEAIKVFRQMVSDKIEEASAYNNLAVIYASRGDFEAARSALDWAIRSKPDYSTAYHNLGNVYANLAGQSYRQALQLDRGDRYLPAKLSRISEVLGQTVAPSSEPAAPLASERDEVLARVPASNANTSGRLLLSKQDDMSRQ
jgi:tetratricopeptide (TPR) repeat protein